MTSCITSVVNYLILGVRKAFLLPVGFTNQRVQIKLAVSKFRESFLTFGVSRAFDVFISKVSYMCLINASICPHAREPFLHAELELSLGFPFPDQGAHPSNLCPRQRRPQTSRRHLHWHVARHEVTASSNKVRVSTKLSMSTT